MHPFSHTHRARAFTLVELLIVVAIIAILAAIAVPNFQEAVVRCRVARTKDDLRSLGTGLEAYRTDYTAYPRADINMALAPRLVPLTTPVAYLSSLFEDPFFAKSGAGSSAPYGSQDPYYCYASGNIYFGTTSQYDSNKYIGSIYSLAGRGPDADIVFGGYCMAHPNSLQTEANLRGAYDPTNGTVSEGDIFRLSAGTLGKP